MQHVQDLDLDVIRPWRRATIAVSVVAAVELVVLAAIAIVLLGNPLASHLRETEAVAGTPRVRTAIPAPAKKAALDRADTSVMVLNGGGRSGAAHAAADRVSAHGYQLGQVGNAAGDTPRTLIMYRRGYEAEGARLGRDLHVRIVRPARRDRARPATGRAPRADHGQVAGSTLQRAWSSWCPARVPGPKRKLSSVYA